MQILEHILKIRREKEKHEFSQTVGNHLALRNFLFALRNLQCGFRIAKFRIAKFPNGFSHCQMDFRIAKWFFALPNGFSHCQMDFRIAKWFFALPNGFSHCQMVFRIAKFAVVFRIAKFRIAKFATHCEQFAKIPTVLPSDFVLRITFSSELRFRRFWYRWKA